MNRMLQGVKKVASVLGTMFVLMLFVGVIAALSPGKASAQLMTGAPVAVVTASNHYTPTNFAPVSGGDTFYTNFLSTSRVLKEGTHPTVTDPVEEKSQLGAFLRGAI